MADPVPFAAEPTSIAGLLLLRIKQVADDRGVVREFFRASAFTDAVRPAPGPWRQMNVTQTRRGALRGIHAEAMSKLVAVVSGTAFGAYVDLRVDSDTRGAVVTADLGPGIAVLVPAGVGNGFQSTGEQDSQYLYAFDDEWRPDMPGQAITPLDPALRIAWPIPIERDDPSQISAKDVAAPTLAELFSTKRPG